MTDKETSDRPLSERRSTGATGRQQQTASRQSADQQSADRQSVAGNGRMSAMMSAMPWGPAAAHLLTAIGAVVALLATRAVLNDAWEEAFGWLGLALLIDGIDGPFARHTQAALRLPRFSGERLDLIIDYLTYVFVPVLMLLQGSYLTGISGGTLASLILLSALYHFSDMDSKCGDSKCGDSKCADPKYTDPKCAANCFVGFPAAWNVITFYVFAFALREFWASMLVALFVVLTFVPLRWVHPVRVAWLRPLTALLSSLWLALAAWALYQGLPAPLWQQILFALLGVYAMALSLWRGLHQR